MKKRIFAILIAVMTMVSCGVQHDVSKAYNMVRCKYTYNSISNLSVMDMDLTQGVSITQIPRVTALLAGKNSAIPVSFDVNLNVYNPNEAAAQFAGLDYIIQIDDIEFAIGRISQTMNINAGATQNLALSIGVDLASLISKNSKDAIFNIVRNMIGLSGKKSEIYLQIKPAFNIKGVVIQSPLYIPIKFEFGGRR